MRLTYVVMIVIFFLLIFGCTTEIQPQDFQQTNSTQPIVSNASNITDGIGTGTAEQPESKLNFKEWKSPDGAMTLQVPEGWKASEKQVDTCTVNWAVVDVTGTSSAYMTNEILIFKYDNAKQLYKAYGLTGIDSAPVSSYLKVEQGVKQIFAPLTGASDVHFTYTDYDLSQQFSQAVCTIGLAACDAQVFEAAYKLNGVLMRGMYLVQTYDFGEGNTWWMNVWGYTAPAANWNATSQILETVFNSAKYTDEWASKCQSNAGNTETTIDEIIKSRQESSDKAAEAWDKYIRGE